MFALTEANLTDKMQLFHWLLVTYVYLM